MTDLVERLNDSLSAGYSELRKEAAIEIMRLRAKIEAMERQRSEPAARTVGKIGEWVSNGDGTYNLGGCLDAFVPLPDGTLLYTLPGAQTQGEEK